MKFADRESCVAFVEQRYFGNVQGGDIAALMACFCPGAEVLIRHGDNPVRRFTAAGDGVVALDEFYRHLCGNYVPWFGDFRHFVDLGEQRSACYFNVRLTPKAEGRYADAGVQELQNCNFFEYSDGLISHMIIYYTNPQAGSEGGNNRPTGYPQ